MKIILKIVSEAISLFSTKILGRFCYLPTLYCGDLFCQIRWFLRGKPRLLDNMVSIRWFLPGNPRLLDNMVSIRWFLRGNPGLLDKMVSICWFLRGNPRLLDNMVSKLIFFLVTLRRSCVVSSRMFKIKRYSQ